MSRSTRQWPQRLGGRFDRAWQGMRGAGERPLFPRQGAPPIASLLLAPTLDDASAPRPSSTHPPRPAIRVLLADDHKILRDGLASLLGSLEDIEIVGEAEDGVQAVELALELEPDVVVMDVTMPRMNGIDATRKITDALAGVRVIGLSMHEEGDMAGALERAGAMLYLTKGGPANDLIDAIRRAAGRQEPGEA